MPEVVISLDGHAEELAVFGSRDQYLRQVRDAVGVKVLARHGELRVEGESDRVEQARRIFEGLRSLFRARRTILSADVTDLIEKVTGSGDAAAGGTLEIREGNRVVRPRSDGQARYLKALQQNELVFCVGPAGTGKTYLAVALAVSALRKGRIKKIVLVRPAVEAGEHPRFLPRDPEAENKPHLPPPPRAPPHPMDFEPIPPFNGNDPIQNGPPGHI